MRTIIHSNEAATASSASSSPTCFVARGVARPAVAPHRTALLNCWNLLNKFLGSYIMSIMPWLWMFRIDVFGKYATRRAIFWWFYRFDYFFLINFNFQGQPFEILVFLLSECEIVHDACIFMPLIHHRYWQSLCTGLCVSFLCCI